MMNQSFRISEKALRISLIAGSILLVTTVLVLSIAVGASRSKEEDIAYSYLTVTDAPASTATTPPSTEAGTTPEPEPEKPVFRLTLPVDGYLLSVHDLETLSFSVTMQDYRTHNGIDIETTEGAAVVAAATGRVSKAYEDPMMGYTIEIDHGNGYVSVYRNLADTVPDGIEVGATVYAGQLIGAVGSTALAEQAELPHLHFELTCNGEAVDPLTFLSYGERAEE